MQDDSNRNTIIFVIAAILLLLGYQQFVIGPAAKERAAKAAAEAAANPKAAPGVAPGIAAAPKIVTREQAAQASPRVPIATPALMGSISLRGARIDDLFLNQYRVEVDPKSPPVELLRPEGAEHAWFAELGWTGANLPGVPTPETVWTLAEGSTLAPGKPVTLRHVGGAGLVFTRKIALDDKFMFTIVDTVANTGAAPVTLAPYGSIQRQGVPATLGKTQIVHEGGVGVLGTDPAKQDLKEFKYPKWIKDGGGSFSSVGGWAGITDKFWLAAFIPPQTEKIDATFKVTKTGGVDIFESNYVGRARVIPAGKQITETTHLFAGAKTVPLLQKYEKTLGVKQFDRAVDWGFLWFLTRPMLTFLDTIFHYVGNFGVAILLLTVVVRLIFFPLANKQYESITKMKKVQPQMEELKVKFKDDPQKQQQELMALYQREKVNPLAGCVPILFQIPVFYSLYKVLTVTIEMRHAPFLGYIKDLSARDPTSIWTLFGLIPWHPATVPFIGTFLDGPLHLGVLPILYGITMWLTTSMSPPAGDPVQQKIFQFMPLFFTFIMAPFAVGLLIYWTWSNVISIVQQYVIMRRFKVDNPIDKLIRKLTGKEAPAG